jgi:hypothetical protein
MMGLILTITAMILSNPLGLSWDQKYAFEAVPEVRNCNYIYGDVSWGRIIYEGEDFLGTATEIILEFSGRKIAIATLSLGPGGLNDANCISKYKKINKFLSQKYGRLRHSLIMRDPLIEDLFYNRECASVRTGLKYYENTWETRDFQIKSFLFGDENLIIIEVEYRMKNRLESLKKQDMKKILKRI